MDESSSPSARHLGVACSKAASTILGTHASPSHVRSQKATGELTVRLRTDGVDTCVVASELMGITPVMVTKLPRELIDLHQQGCFEEGARAWSFGLLVNITRLPQHPLLGLGLP